MCHYAKAISRFSCASGLTAVSGVNVGSLSKAAVRSVRGRNGLNSFDGIRRIREGAIAYRGLLV